MTDRIALYLQDHHPIAEAISIVQYAEDRGFEAVWQAENRLAHDVVVPMSAYATVTRRIAVGAAAMNVWTRNAAVIASTFLTLDDLAPNRVMCGLGAWWEPLAAKVGVRRERPLLALREMVQVVRALLNRERVSFKGDFVQLDDVELEMLHGRKAPRNVPIYLAASGPQILKLAGEIADGAILNYLVSPAYTTAAVEQLEAGAKIAGRPMAQLDRQQLIVCSVDRDRKRALDTARRFITPYLVQQPQIMRASGVDVDLLNEMGQILTWPSSEEQVTRAMRLVPDDVVQLLTASGTAQEVKHKVADYVAAGATCPVVYPLGPDVRLMIDTLADGYQHG
jgi:5,10-methylenetetrahydromethanopterin reductase